MHRLVLLVLPAIMPGDCAPAAPPWRPAGQAGPAKANPATAAGFAPKGRICGQTAVYGVSKRVLGWTLRPDEIINLNGVVVGD